MEPVHKIPSYHYHKEVQTQWQSLLASTDLAALYFHQAVLELSHSVFIQNYLLAML